MMARIEAQVNAQMSEVFREQVTDKCFVVCADVGKKQMSQREKDCVDRYVEAIFTSNSRVCGVEGSVR